MPRVPSAPIIAIAMVITTIAYLFVDHPLARATIAVRSIGEAELRLLTRLGNSAWYFIGLAAIALTCEVLIRRNERCLSSIRLWRDRAIFSIAAILLVGLATNVLKVCIARSRPRLLIESGIDSFAWFKIDLSARWASFPSGHAATTFAVATLVCAFFPRLGPVAFAIAVLVAATRALLGEHYASDVVVGAALGWVATRALLAAGERRLPQLRRS